MEKLPLVDIIMPVYNSEKTIRNSIESILKQTYKNWCLIIIDDGSTDNTRSIINGYTDKRIKLIKSLNNNGVAASLNIGIDNLNDDSKYVARMDSDDIMLEYRLEKQVEYLEKHEKVSILGSNMIIKKEGSPTNTRFVSHYPTDNISIMTTLLFNNPIAHPTVMLRKNVLKENHYDTKFKWCEDYELWSRLARKKYIFHNITEPLLIYNSSQYSESTRYRYSPEWINIIQEIYSNYYSSIGLWGDPKKWSDFIIKNKVLEPYDFKRIIESSENNDYLDTNIFMNLIITQFNNCIK